MKQITLKNLEKWKSQSTEFELVDVREEEEHEFFNIGGQHIPLEDVIREVDDIRRDIPVIIYCKRGIRSQIAIQKLERKFNFDNLYNLQGGIISLIKKGSL
ncbi:MAG: rhodanese-like domain-containing protein [Saprospiraceae bacterium]